MHDAVRLHGEEGGSVVAGEDAEVSTESGELSGVFANLVRVRDVDPNEVELRIGIDAGNGVLADVARTPRNHAVGHWSPSLHERAPVVVIGEQRYSAIAGSAWRCPQFLTTRR